MDCINILKILHLIEYHIPKVKITLITIESNKLILINFFET